MMLSTDAVDEFRPRAEKGMRATTERARALARRRALIERVSLELFRTRSFDHVTVEDVCAGAGVAPATFYRHFRTKEEVVFAYEGEFTAALRDSFRAAVGLPRPVCLPVVLDHFARYLESQGDVLALRDEIVLGHPRLMQRTLAVQRDMEAVLAEGLAELRGLEAVDAAARLEAGLGIVVLRVGVRLWREEGATSLPDAVHRALARLDELTRSLRGDAAAPEDARTAG